MADKFDIEKELAFHVKLLQRAEEMAGVGHWRIDIDDNNAMFWSEEIFRIYGLNKDDGIPQLEDAINYYHPDDKEFVQDIVTKAIEHGESFTFELRLIRPNGDLRYVQSYGECDLDERGKTKSVFGVFKDITSFKLREKEIEQNNDDMQRLIENIPDFIFVKDNDYRIIQANNAFLKLYPDEIRDNVIGTTTFENYSAKQVAVFTRNDRIALDEGYHESVETITFPNGDVRTLFTKKVGYQDAHENKFFLGISRDITQIKKTEDELIRSNSELERFAYIASHDLQEPLRMVRSFTSLLQDEYADSLDETANQYINFATDGAIRMQSLIEDLLEYSRLGTGDNNLKIIDCNEIMELAIMELNQAIKESGVIIEYDTLPTEITANSIRFMRLLQNLIGNAIKYSKADGTPHIYIKCEDTGPAYQFSIIDNGIGIRPEYTEKIFNIFERLHGKDKYSGTGIGLAICKRIVDNMSGKIWAKSIVGKGSTFYFTVPKQNQCV